LSTNIKSMKKIVIFLFSLLAVLTASAQSEQYLQQADQMLKGTNVSKEELDQRLKTKGIDLSSIDPAQLPSLQGKIESTIKEIQSEKASVIPSQTSIEKVEVPTTESNVYKLEVSKDPVLSKHELPKGKAQDDPLFGHSIFYNESIEFYTTTQTSTPPDYFILDAGDKVVINIFGKSQADLIYEIEPDGFIRPAGMYKIYLKGLSLKKAKQLLEKRFAQAYSFGKGQFNVDITSSRSIKVNIFGEVQNPGTYSISAYNSVIGAIIAAGGPTSKGSIRKIKVIKDGKDYEVDLYDFVSGKSLIDDLSILNNTTIFISSQQNVVRLRGPFNNTGRFEVLSTEKVEDLVSLGGGINKKMVLSNVNLARVKDNTSQLTTYTYSSLKSMTLQDQDVVTFREAIQGYNNYVKIIGATRYPGEYALESSTTLKRVLSEAGIEPFTRLDIGYIVKRNIDSTSSVITFSPKSVLEGVTTPELQSGDIVTLLNKQDFTNSFYFSVNGAVNSPFTDKILGQEGDLRVSDALLLAGGANDNATKFGYIKSRSSANSNEITYKMVNLEAAMSSPNGTDDAVLAPFDELIVPQVESFEDKLYVRIAGSVRKPSRYEYSESLTLKDIIVMSDGLKTEAAGNKVDIFRLRTDGNNPTSTLMQTVTINKNLDPLSAEDRVTLQPHDVIVVRKIPDFDAIETVYIGGRVKYPGIYAITEGKESISDLVKKAGGLSDDAQLDGATFYRKSFNLGFVAIDFNKALNRDKSNDLPLLKGDSIHIPVQLNTVQVSIAGTNADEFYMESALNNKSISTPFFKGKRAGFYVRNYAGGYDTDAKRSKTFVRRANGRLKKTINLGLFRIQPKVKPGSDVIVSLKPKKKKEDRKTRKKNEDRDLYADIRDLLALITSAVTVVVLADRL